LSIRNIFPSQRLLNTVDVVWQVTGHGHDVRGGMIAREFTLLRRFTDEGLQGQARAISIQMESLCDSIWMDVTRGSRMRG
jgi:hypothetical protein